MTDYSKPGEALRCCISNPPETCVGCTYNTDVGCNVARMMSDAADAIEALQAEVERLKDSNEELREKQTFIDHYGTEWMTSAKDVPTAAYQHGYADGFAEARVKKEVQDDRTD